MLLTVDIGNTTIQAGVFQGAELGPTWRLKTDHLRLADEYGILLLSLLRNRGIDSYAIAGVAMACVVPPLTPVFQDVSRRFFGADPIVVGSGIKTGLRIVFDNPREVGADRVADAVAALRLHGPPPLVVVDFGTATVFDAIDAAGDYVGGAIAPGIAIAAEALFERTSLLQRVDLERPNGAIGRSTAAAMQSGILFGYVGLVEGLVARFRDQLGGGRVIGTGGWAERIAKETTVVDRVEPDLTLHGLRLLYDLNAGPSGGGGAA